MANIHFSADQVVSRQDTFKDYVLVFENDKKITVNIDDVCEELKTTGKIKKVVTGPKIIGGEMVKHYYEYNGEAYGYMLQVATKVTDSDILECLRSENIAFSIEPLNETV